MFAASPTEARVPCYQLRERGLQGGFLRSTGAGASDFDEVKFALKREMEGQEFRMRKDGHSSTGWQFTLRAAAPSRAPSAG
jgi:hypothetical protein